ncbi:endo-1,4-beta-xylanase [Salegentibacter sp. LM13S]|uniref:endo-1,4-beta-xylanase n=1 Tax=Salegentibacter lacus TaxID=2873599 RepID=UPI001CCC97B1|nr:endo-1,4-beta-xylanase [Salegentibacter lacus]MBZ9630271.1 endo-1,4-beta-xylanase [Salegentibacter lacus]
MADIPKEGCGEDIPDTGDDDYPLTYNASALLKNSTSFPIGNIVSASKLTSNNTNNTDFKKVLERKYNSITAENDMKMANFFLGPDNYDYSDGDEIINYAIENIKSRKNIFRLGINLNILNK